MIENKTISATNQNADTRDIISAIQAALIPAVENYKKNFQLLDGTDPVYAAIQAATKIQKNVRYKADGFKFQKIRLPGRLFQDKTGDCKSFSLFISAALTASKIPNGLRFASYQKNLIPTHVYNFVIVNGRKFFIDACRKSLSEAKTYTFVKDMQVQYLSGLPILVNSSEGIGRRGTRAERRAARQERRENRPNVAKKVALTPARGPFLGLVALNFRGIASKLDRLNQNKPEVVKKFWLRLGGAPDKLIGAINKGKEKKPLFGQKINGATQVAYLGEPVTASALIVAAGGILAALQQLFKKEGIPLEENLAEEGTLPIDDGAGFDVTDPETPEAAAANQAAAVRRAATPQRQTTNQSATKPAEKSSLILPLGIAAALALFAFKK
jgi:hypothetical protein